METVALVLGAIDVTHLVVTLVIGGVIGWVASIVMKTLARKPGDRFPDITALRLALAIVLLSTSLAARASEDAERVVESGEERSRVSRRALPRVLCRRGDVCSDRRQGEETGDERGSTLGERVT